MWVADTLLCVLPRSRPRRHTLVHFRAGNFPTRNNFAFHGSLVKSAPQRHRLCWPYISGEQCPLKQQRTSGKSPLFRRHEASRLPRHPLSGDRRSLCRLPWPRIRAGIRWSRLRRTRLWRLRPWVWRSRIRRSRIRWSWIWWAWLRIWWLRRRLQESYWLRLRRRFLRLNPNCGIFDSAIKSTLAKICFLSSG